MQATFFLPGIRQKDEPSANPYSKRLALGELLGAAGLAQTDLLTFDFTSVAGHETGVGENALEAGRRSRRGRA